MTEEPQGPQDDETPDAGDVADPQSSADAGESPADEPTAEAPGDESAAEAPAEETAPEAPAEETAPEAPAEEPVAEAPAEEAAPEAPAEEPVAEAPADEPPAEEPVAEAPAEEPPAEGPAADEPAVEAPAAAEAPAADAAAQGGDATPEAERRERPKPGAKRRRDKDGDAERPDVVPGAHLEPDLVLEGEQGAQEQDEYGAYAQTYGDTGGDDGGPAAAAPEAGEAAEQPEARKPIDIAADARYQATGKRKTAVARVILKPGTGVYLVNGRPLEVFFPRAGLQRNARQPLETAGYEARMDVVAKIHGGGVSSQAGALRHGIARALTEADPALRTELKRKGFLTRDARVKERKKAGLKKARKRPQFSKR